MNSIVRNCESYHISQPNFSKIIFLCCGIFKLIKKNTIMVYF